MNQPTMRLTKRCSASPERVYDVIADLRTHLVWGGARQSRRFRLLSLEAPAGPATAGTAFTSTGTIPMSLRRWADSSTVTVADRPRTLEIVTRAKVPRARRPLEATYRHRYEITEVPGGSEVRYELTQLALSHPFLRLALPVVRTMTWRVGLPLLGGRGFRNLLATAERSAGVEGAPIPA